MSASEPQPIPFDGVRLRYGSTKSFDELVDAVARRRRPRAGADRRHREEVRQLGVLRTRGAFSRRPERLHAVRHFEPRRVDRQGRHREEGAPGGYRQSADRDHDAAS